MLTSSELMELGRFAKSLGVEVNDRFEIKFKAGQPRVPAGSSRGGEFASGGSTAGGTGGGSYQSQVSKLVSGSPDKEVVAGVAKTMKANDIKLDKIDSIKITKVGRDDFDRPRAVFTMKFKDGFSHTTAASFKPKEGTDVSKMPIVWSGG